MHIAKAIRIGRAGRQRSVPACRSCGARCRMGVTLVDARREAVSIAKHRAQVTRRPRRRRHQSYIRCDRKIRTNATRGRPGTHTIDRTQPRHCNRAPGLLRIAAISHARTVWCARESRTSIPGCAAGQETDDGRRLQRDDGPSCLITLKRQLLAPGVFECR